MQLKSAPLILSVTSPKMAHSAKDWFSVRTASIAKGYAEARRELRELALNSANETEAATEHLSKTLEFNTRVTVSETDEFYTKTAKTEVFENIITTKLKALDSGIKFYKSVSRFDKAGALDTIDCKFADKDDIQRRAATYREMEFHSKSIVVQVGGSAKTYNSAA